MLADKTDLASVGVDNEEEDDSDNSGAEESSEEDDDDSEDDDTVRLSYFLYYIVRSPCLTLLSRLLQIS